VLFPESAALYKPGFRGCSLAVADTDSNTGTGVKIIAMFNRLGVVLALMTRTACRRGTFQNGFGNEM